MIETICKNCTNFIPYLDGDESQKFKYAECKASPYIDPVSGETKHYFCSSINRFADVSCPNFAEKEEVEMGCVHGN